MSKETEFHPVDRALQVLVVHGGQLASGEHCVEVRFHTENDAREFASWVCLAADCPQHVFVPSAED